MTKIWFSSELPAPTIIEEADIGTEVELREYGFLTDDTLYCSPFDCRDIEPKLATSNMSSDGCTGFLDGWWKHCCILHDNDYKKGGSWLDRIFSDARLCECVLHTILDQRWYWWWLILVLPLFMFVGVRIGGSPWCLPLYLWPRWRKQAVWGFGRKK